MASYQLWAHVEFSAPYFVIALQLAIDHIPTQFWPSLFHNFISLEIKGGFMYFSLCSLFKFVTMVKYIISSMPSFKLTVPHPTQFSPHLSSTFTVWVCASRVCSSPAFKDSLQVHIRPFFWVSTWKIVWFYAVLIWTITITYRIMDGSIHDSISPVMPPFPILKARSVLAFPFLGKTDPCMSIL